MTWLLPELDVGEEPELRPLELELLELLELEEDEPELVSWSLSRNRAGS